MAINLSNLAISSSEPFDVEITHPATGEVLLDNGVPVTITVLSKTSNEYRSVLAAQQNARLKRTKKQDIIVEDFTRDGVELLAAVTVGSNGLEYKGSEDVDFAELYGDVEMFWIKDQVYLALEDNANFLAM